MGLTTKKPKLTAEEKAEAAAKKAEAKARAAAIKARNAEYKKVAKLLKSKDPIKRHEGLEVASKDFEFFTAGNCLVPLVENLVPTKKTLEAVLAFMSVLNEFLSTKTPIASSQQQEQQQQQVDNASFLFNDMAKNGDNFKGVNNLSSLLLHDNQELKLGALQAIKSLVVYMATEAPTTMAPDLVAFGQQSFLATQDLALNLAALFTRLTKEPDLPFTTLNDILICLNFVASKDYSKLGGVITADQGLSSIIHHLPYDQVQEQATMFLDTITHHLDGLTCSFDKNAPQVIAKVLAAQVEAIKSSDVRQIAVQEASGAATGASRRDSKSRASKVVLPAKGSTKGGKEVSAPITAAGQLNAPPSLPLEVVLKNLSRLADVFTRYAIAESPQGVAGGITTAAGALSLAPMTASSVGALDEEVVGSVVISLTSVMQLPMVWDHRKVMSRAVSQALGVVGSGLESRRLLVRDTMVMSSLLTEVLGATDGSPEGLHIRKTAEKTLHHLLLPLPSEPHDNNDQEAIAAPGPVDDTILTGGTSPYLKPELLIGALASDDEMLWQAALRLMSQLCLSHKNILAFGPVVVPTLSKIGQWCLAKLSTPHEERGSSLVKTHVLSTPINSLVIHMAQVLTSMAQANQEAITQALGTEEPVTCLTNLIAHGPLSASQFHQGMKGKEGYDEPFDLYLPQHWKWDLSGMQHDQPQALPVAKVVPRARLVDALAAITYGRGPGAGRVVANLKACSALVDLLAVDVDVDNTPRCWESFKTPDERLLQEQLRIALLDLFTAVVGTPGGRIKLMETVSSFRPSWAPGTLTVGEQSPWTAPKTFKLWDLNDDQPQALEGAYPYIRVLSGVLAPIFDAQSEEVVMANAIKAIDMCCWDKTVGEGQQDALVDNLAGMALSMGAVVPLVSYLTHNNGKASPTTKHIIQRLVPYLINRGMDRELYWANVPTLPPEEPVDPKAKAPPKKKLTPEEEAKLKEMQNMKGRPDPNGGPNAEQWKMLLNVPGKDTRTGHDKSSAMLAMIIAHEGALLDVLYKAGAMPTVVDERGRTPLMDALVHGNDNAVKEQVELGAHVNAFDNEGTTVLKFAFVSPTNEDLLVKLQEVKNNNPEVVRGAGSHAMLKGGARLVQYLLSQGADPNISDMDGNFPLHWALCGTYVTGYIEGEELTLTNGIYGDDAKPKDEEVLLAHKALLDLLLAHGARVDVANRMGHTPLITAVQGGYAPFIYDLLQYGADPNVADVEGRLPLHYACAVAAPGYDSLLQSLLTAGERQAVSRATHNNMRKGKTVVEKQVLEVQELLSNGLNEALCPQVVKEHLPSLEELVGLTTTESEYTCLHYLCGAGQEQSADLTGTSLRDPDTIMTMARLLLSRGQIDINRPGAVDRMTPLHLAAKHTTSCELLSLLLGAGADMNQLDAYNMTPLMYTLQLNRLDMARVLLQDPKTMAVIPGGVNAMALACASPNAPEDIISTLLDRTRALDPQLASLNIQSPEAQEGGDGSIVYANPLCIAVSTGNHTPVKILASEANIMANLQDGSNKETPLHVACQLGDQDMVELLLTLRPDLDLTLRDGKGQTPLYVAVQGNALGIVALLLNNEAAQRALVDEVENPSSFPCTLHAAESVHLSLAQAHGDDDGCTTTIWKMIMGVVGRKEGLEHLHDRFTEGLTYHEWLRRQADVTSAPPYLA